VVGSIWTYKVKQVVDGSIENYKAISMAKGFSQVERIDYEDNLYLMSRYSSIRTILVLAM